MFIMFPFIEKHLLGLRPSENFKFIRRKQLTFRVAPRVNPRER